jgi:transposase-like protein
MAHLVREHMAGVDGDPPLSGHVEADETFVGGKRHGGGRKRTMANKTIVFGMLARKGDVMTQVVANRETNTLERIIAHNVKPGSEISTDEHSAYRWLSYAGYKHEAVNHSAKEYVRGKVHTNCLEGFWSQLKRSISGTHVHVSAKYLGRYLGEFEFRYNLRHAPSLMFDRLVESF